MQPKHCSAMVKVHFSMISIQYVFKIYLSDRVRLMGLSIHMYKQSVRYLQTMPKSYVQHNYLKKKHFNLLAPIYKQTRQFVVWPMLFSLIFADV